MKIYKLSASDEGLTACLSKSNSVGVLDFWDSYENDMDSDRPLGNWSPVNFYTDCEMNIRKRHNDILKFNMGYFVANSRARTLLESEYPDVIQFVEVNNEDDQEDSYSLLYPVVSLPALDLDRSECRFVSGKHYTNIYTYVFNEDIRYRPIFKLRNYDPAKRAEWVDKTRIFVTEQFKEFVELHRISGFVFEKVYDTATRPADGADKFE